MEPHRLNHSNCSESVFSAFAAALATDKNIKIISHKTQSEKCHFIRYNVRMNADKASIVYDTKANILTFTAGDLLIAKLNDMYSESAASVNSKTPAKNKVKEFTPQNKVKRIEKNTSKPNKSPRDENTTSKSSKVNPLEAESLQYKNGYSVKNFSVEKLNLLLKRIRTTGAKAKVFNVVDKGKHTELKSYLIEDEKNQKVFLRFMPQKKVVQLQGKRSKLFGEIQVLLNNDTDFISAVNSHIELTGEQRRAREVERQIKKALPNAYDFLSEQSKIDFSIGLMDIGNDEVKLSDYSVLLVPPYRGLERLIFDLQRANGIDVKMIGQAFERPNGIYELKIGYKKKINSIVYCEVMTALYTEYFEKRNFYAHADNSEDSINRALSDKLAAKTIFDKLLDLIDYNCKKLIEIGFKNKFTKEKIQ